MKSERILSRWGILMVGESGPILAGCEDLEIKRTSTPLVEFDPASLTGVTAAGRPYRLVGEPEPGYAMSAFLSFWDPQDKNVRVVTPEQAVALIAASGNAPFEHTEEEQTALDRLKVEHFAGQTRMQMRAMEIGEAEAARRSGLTVEKLRGLLAGDPQRITADEADAAFVRLVGTAYGWVRDDVDQDAIEETEVKP